MTYVLIICWCLYVLGISCRLSYVLFCMDPHLSDVPLYYPYADVCLSIFNSLPKNMLNQCVLSGEREDSCDQALMCCQGFNAKTCRVVSNR